MDKVLLQLSPLLILIIFMYFLFIKPQRKREKDTNTMRQSLKVGDEIITIGGICGKVVKTKEETIVIQVGAEKLKFEMMRWAVSSVVNRDALADAKKTKEDKTEEAPAPKKSLPKKMKKAESADAPAENAVEKEPQSETAEDKTEA